MARKRDRIFALVMAGAFLLTTVGVGVGVIYQIVQESRDDSTATNTADVTDTTEQKPVSEEDKLEGKNMENFEPITSAVTELQIIDLKEGNGAAVKEGETVTVDYTGAVASTGKVFESSKDSGQTATFALSGVIEGWTKGMPGMKEGGVRRLIIPKAMAYGAAQGHELQNDDLVFDIELHKIGQ